MADFVAVIRRAVDGLANNTPEMRVKVYDKARSAVVRQLESMKPRPPEALFQRQLEKLEQAIAEVEAEHAEALPEDDAAPAVAPEPEPAPVPDEPAPPEEPVAEASPEPESEPAPAEPVEEAPAHDEEPEQPGEAEPETPPEPEPVAPEVPAWAEPEPAAQDEEPAPEEEADEPARPETAGEQPAFADEPEPVAADEPEPARPFHEEPPAYSDTVETIEQVEAGYADDLPEHAPAEPAPEDYVEPAPTVEPEPVYPAPEAFEPAEPVEEEPAAEVSETFEPEPTPEATAEPETEPEPPHWPEAEKPAEAAAPPEAAWDWPAHEEIELPASPAASDAKRSPDSIIDDFDAYLEGRVATPAEPAPVPEDASGKDKPDANDAWADFEALIGYNGGPAPAAGEKAVEDEAGGKAGEQPIEALTEGEERLAGETAYPYRAVPKPRPSLARIGLAGLAVLLLAGGGYALWLNRDALTSLFNGPATPSGTPVVATGNGATAPENGSAAPAHPEQTTEESPGIVKFTQRLTPDGTEVDEGPAPGPGGAPAGEGQSVAEQNVAPPTQTQQPGGPQNGAATAPVASGEKMYLYEEMLGQSTPTAVEGGVVWEAREEQDDAGRPQAVVQGTVSVPGRNLTALVTFKRNTDPSLPASHLVEIVFSLPADFAGGAVESVQRISMKRTEQDRGNPLIAVPARITDDFHMIALNDFPDARATNLELLRSRDWIDIPVTYRNGRRALLTMEKGATGVEAFNKAMGQWQQAEAAQQ